MIVLTGGMSVKIIYPRNTSVTSLLVFAFEYKDVILSLMVDDKNIAHLQLFICSLHQLTLI